MTEVQPEMHQDTENKDDEIGQGQGDVEPWSLREQAVSHAAVGIYLIRTLMESVSGIVASPFRSLQEKPTLTAQETDLSKYLLQHTPSLKSYTASPWAPGPISQTVLGLAKNSGSTVYQRRDLLMASDGVELLIDWKENDDLPDQAPIMLILHGIGGGSDSRLATHLTDVVQSQGWRAAVFNRRGHGESSVLPGQLAPRTPYGQDRANKPSKPTTPTTPSARQSTPSAEASVSGRVAKRLRWLGDAFNRTTSWHPRLTLRTRVSWQPVSQEDAELDVETAGQQPPGEAVGTLATTVHLAQSASMAVETNTATTANTTTGSTVLQGAAVGTSQQQVAVGAAEAQPQQPPATADSDCTVAATPAAAATAAAITATAAATPAAAAMAATATPSAAATAATTAGPASTVTPAAPADDDGMASPASSQEPSGGPLTAGAAATTSAAGEGVPLTAGAAATISAAGEGMLEEAHAVEAAAGAQCNITHSQGNSTRPAVANPATPFRTSQKRARSLEGEQLPQLPVIATATKTTVHQHCLTQVRRVFPGHCDTDDLQEVVAHIHRRHPGAPIVTLGFSQGSNLLVHFLGKVPKDQPPPFAAALSVSNAYDLNFGTLHLSKNWVTDAVVTRPVKRLLRKELKSVRKLAAAHGLQLDLERALFSHSIREFDAALLKAWGYDTIEDYYCEMSSQQALHDINLPLLLINNVDDPIIHDSLPGMAQAAARDNPWLIAACTKRGGHLGWLQGWSGRHWLSDVLMEYAKAAVSEEGLKLAAELRQRQQQQPGEPGAAQQAAVGTQQAVVAAQQVAVDMAAIAAPPPVDDAELGLA